MMKRISDMQAIVCAQEDTCFFCGIREFPCARCGREHLE